MAVAAAAASPATACFFVFISIFSIKISC